MSSTPTTSPPADLDVYYPDSDGRPIGETGWHVCSTLALYGMLRQHLAHSDAYVAATMFLYYEPGNPRANPSPDCMVILGVGSQERRSFKTWIEGAVPSVIFEFTSDETIDEDLQAKRLLYERLGVAEYFLFDPLGDCLNPRLRGFRLDAGEYVPLVPDPLGSLVSQVLGLGLIPEGILLCAIDVRTNRPLLTNEEMTDALAGKLDETERLRRRAEAERQRADILASELERLRDLLGPQGQTGDQPAAGV